jgi:hypothetical protein
VAGGAEIEEIEMQVLDLINDAREKQGLPWLSWNDRLFQVGRDHSEEMAMINEPRNTDECTFGIRLRAAGYDWSIASEIIAAKEATAKALFNSLMKSDSQRAELLSASYGEIGIGYAADELSDHVHFWTLNLGTRRSMSGGSQAGPEVGFELGETRETRDSFFPRSCRFWYNQQLKISLRIHEVTRNFIGIHRPTPQQRATYRREIRRLREQLGFVNTMMRTCR